MQIAAVDADEQEDWSLKARLAVVLLHFEEPELAAEMCSLRDDPIQRSTFIREFATWHGPLTTLAALPLDDFDDSFRYSLCSGIGSIALDRLELDEGKAWTDIFWKWFRHQSDSGTSNSRSRQMRSDSRAKSQLSRLAFRKPAMLAVA